MEKQIGWYTLKEDKVFQNDFETAAWYENVLVMAGRYPVNVVDYRISKHPHPHHHNAVKGHIGGVYVTMPGTITSDNFGSLFYGVPIGTYDTAQNAGKPSRHILFAYMYSVADSVLNDPETPWELFPEYEARRIDFEYDGKPCTTHGIFIKEAQE